MEIRSKHVTSRRFALAVAVAALVGALFSAGSAAADYSVEQFQGELTDPSGSPLMQAAAHPDVTTDFWITSGETLDASFKDAKVDFPPGLIMNPGATPKCTQADVAGITEGGQGGAARCNPAAQVGVLTAYLKFTGVPFPIPIGPAPVFNVKSPAGVPARFATNIASVVVSLDGGVRPEDGYAISAVSRGTSQTFPFMGAKVTIWGVPNSPAHDAERVCRGEEYGPCASPVNPKPLTSMASDCSAGLLTTKLGLNSWEEPDEYRFASFDHDANANPIEATGCERVPFDPKLSLRPSSHTADSPTAVDVELRLPQSEDPGGLSTGLLHTAKVTLPKGMALNPASADGLQACGPEDISLGTNDPVRCPAASVVGSVNIETPLLEKPMSGQVYLAKQGDNPFNSLLALYIVAEGPGVIVKIPGRVDIDRGTGQLTTRFTDSPELPFDALHLRFRGGNRSVLMTPPACGTYTTTTEFSSWSAADPDNPTPAETVTTTNSFEIVAGPNGGPCPAGGFGPGLQAGTASPIGGEYTPLALRITRADGEQLLGSMQATLPEGLMGKLRGVAYCSDEALRGISGAQGSAGAEVASPSCPSASQVGTITAGAGAGTTPFYLSTGRVYLAGPYKGAPLSLVVVVPALAGPLDLGNVVVRNAIKVDPVTAQITAVSDSFPTSLHGIGLDLRDIRVGVNRPEFTLNPTNCDPMAVNGLIGSSLGSFSSVSERFQVGACERLAFKPKLALRLSGAPPRRGGYPKLTATLTMPKGANTEKAVVTMPKTQFLENAHIRTICTRVQYAAGRGGGEGCPAASVYGYAKAWTPLLDEPLQGPVYLRSSSNKLPDLVASLDGAIHVDLVGRIDSPNARIRNTFESVPDAPVSKFVLTMQGGRKGLLVNNTNLCKAEPRASVQFDGQNGKISDSNPLVKVGGCGKKAKKRRK